MNQTATSPSDVCVYTHGAVKGEYGAYAYIILDCKDYGLIDGIQWRTPVTIKSKFVQGGKTTDSMRMKMRAIYEGVRHSPDGSTVKVYLGDNLLVTVLETAVSGDPNFDIAQKYRSYIQEHRITPVFEYTKMYSDSDFPCNNHDEWIWFAHQLCESEILRLKAAKK